MIFGDKILKYKDEFLKDLNTLLSFESVYSDKPEECEKAMEFILKRANDFGLVTEKVSDKSCHIQLGNGGKLCGVLSHLDVVPAGNNWKFPAFELTESENRLFGRGIADDKGSALINLYCLRALKDENIEGKNTLRAIYGITEECGMEDMDEYFSKMPVPDLSFTPDNEYGICFAEKGILQIEISAKNNDAKVIVLLNGGNAINAVPDFAYTILDSSDYDEQHFIELAKESDGNFEFNSTIDGLMIISRGKASHACEPELGYNAITSLVDLIARAYDKEDLGDLCNFIDYAISKECNGRSLGLKIHDSISGDLTANLGYIYIDGESSRAAIDIRYPVSVTGYEVYKQFRKVAKHSNLRVKVLNHEKPLFVEKNSELVTLLSEAYKNIMGENPDLYATGGGTYARKLGGNGVAFGPAFKDDVTNMHNANESIDKEKFFKHAQICLEAFYKLYTFESEE